jgi:hypothetical protein
MSRKRLQLKGRKFGELTVLEYVRTDAELGSIWMAECSCGNVQEVVGRYLTSKKVKRCRNHGVGLGKLGSGAIITKTLPKGMRSNFTELIKYCIKKRLHIEVTPQQFKEFIDNSSKKCTLCGRRHGGVQLADRDVGLIFTNMIILCTGCIEMSSRHTVAKLLEYSLRVAAYIRSLNNSN